MSTPRRSPNRRDTAHRHTALRHRPAAVALIALLLTACAGSTGGDGDASAKRDFTDLTAQTAVEVDSGDNTFTPQYIKVKPGTTVTFVNKGRINHNVRPDKPGAFTPIETEAFTPGDRVSITFDTPGEFGYHCSLHGAPGRVQHGVVRVEG